jgi:Flp pilus assembly protein TadG
MAAVELALCLPVVITLAFGTIELCNVVYVRTRMLSAAYESCRLATRPTTSSSLAATSSQVTTYCNSLLTQFGVNGATVTLSPSSLTSAVPQTVVSVSITAPWSQNTVTSVVLQNAMTINASATLVCE